MDTNYLAYFIHQQNIRKYLFLGFFALLLFGLPIWFYIYSYLETANFGIDLLGIERYNERNNDALKYAFYMFLMLLIICLPAFIFLNTFFNRYENVLNQFTTAEIETLKTINNALAGFDKFMPSFLITAQNMHVFSMKQYTIPIQSISAHSVTRFQTRYSFMYKVEIKTNDRNYYNFNISNNQTQVDYLKMVLAKTVSTH